MIPFAYQTITLYNKLTKRGADGRTAVTWYRHVLTGCFWREVFRTVASGETLVQVHEITCKIPESALYLPYAQWAADGVDRATKFTLSVDDIIALGNVAYTIGSSYTANAVRELCQRTGVMTVVAASDNTRRPMPHYGAKGA